MLYDSIIVAWSHVKLHVDIKKINYIIDLIITQNKLIINMKRKTQIIKQMQTVIDISLLFSIFKPAFVGN